MSDRIQELLAYWEQVEEANKLAIPGNPDPDVMRDTIAALELLSRAKAIHISSGADRRKRQFTAADCAAFASIIGALEAQERERAREANDGRYVPIPKNADQAELMVKLGVKWLQDKAPERLRKAPDPTTLPRYMPTTRTGLPGQCFMARNDSGRFLLYADVLVLVCEHCTPERRCPDHGAVVSDGHV